MSPNIDEAAFNQLVSLGIPTDDAISCLKACNNDPNQAAEHFFGGGLEKERQNNRWDDSVWSQPREGFQIESHDSLPSSSFEGTKSRPPSRVSTQGRNDSDDLELAKAIAASMCEQDTGIVAHDNFTYTSPANPNFVPAQENKEYDPSQWALTTTQAEEIVLDPLPKDRKREPGAPAFLRPSRLGNSLSGALTIFHSIPLAREALLSRGYSLSDYGSHPQWWKGERIQSTHVVDIDNDHISSDQVEEELSEIQRLMAFLDWTERAYGSVDNLINIPRVVDKDQNLLSSFFRGWKSLIETIYKSDNTPPESNAFTSSAYQLLPSGNSEETTTFSVLDPFLSPGDTTLYGILDNMIWSDEGNPVYVEFADIICVQLKMDADCSAPNIEIPAILYPDRYTKPWLGLANCLRRDINLQRTTIFELEAQEEKLLCYSQDNVEYNPKELLELTIAHFATPLPKRNNVNITMDTQPEAPDPTPLLKQLMAKLEKKLSKLEQQKIEAQKTLQNLRQKYTCPEKCDNESPPLTKYFLCGVCMEPTTTFLLGPGEQGPDGNPQKQWWCFAYTQDYGSNPDSNDRLYATYNITKLTEEDVLSGAGSKSDSVLLVYANENALRLRDGSEKLSDPLKEFVDRDNEVFSVELVPTTISPKSERKKRQICLEDEEMGESCAEQGSPKRSSNRSSSTTTGNVSIVTSPSGRSTIIEEIELMPRKEMMEKDGIVSPMLKQFRLDSDLERRTPEIYDEDMPDVEDVVGGKPNNG